MVKFRRSFIFACALCLSFAPMALAVSDSYRDLSARLVTDAEQVLLQGQADEADNLLNLALTADPGNARAYVLKGQAQRSLGNKEEGLRLISVGLDIEPGDVEALQLQGEAALETGNVEQAEKSLSHLRMVCKAPCKAANDLAAAIEQSRIAKKD